MTTVTFEGKKYQLVSDADFTNRVLPVNGYNDREQNDGKYDFEMSAGAVDEDGNNCVVYWIFENDPDKELDEYDYSKVDRVESI